MSAESSNLSNIEHRSVIKYFVKKGKRPKEIFEDMVSVLQEFAPSMVKNGLAYVNGRRAVKMILAQGVLDDFRQVRIFGVSRDNIDEICDRIVTVDETWVRQYDPESKQESMQWTKKEKGRRRNSRFKVGIEAYGDNFGIVKAREAVVQKRRGKLSRGVLFLQDNASVHTARVSRQALKDTGFSEIDHPPYSPDLAPSDYFLFSNLK
ncbi:Histone-lysine N-methyltransferase SETMAR [Eumeta japonica]|uniref:Histone-lysine N-methyltransferase SETMAR n=1 Tax=Eumeta variegata TaxID=151549 RepID=A0A4C1VGP1_EUMVA|nr:Histone-lysine N-methyltransferase SETMAR [Eumeta japonica]